MSTLANSEFMYYTALIGNPVEHSVSPVMYEYFAAQCGIEYRHLKINVEAAKLHAAIKALQELGFCGANVTLPYKQDVAEYLNALDDAVVSCGAVNTITFDQGHSKGWNTDWVGIAEGLKAHGIKGCTKAAVFGSGGAARAAIYALKELGCTDVRAFYRKPEDTKTKELIAQAETMGVAMLSYDHLGKAISDVEIICNMSSAGMVGQDTSPFELRRLDGVGLKATTFLDAVFNPVDTPLLTYFKGRGLTTIDGLWMMLYQGLAAFREWTGQEVVLTDVQRNELHDLLENEVAHGTTRH